MGTKQLPSAARPTPHPPFRCLGWGPSPLLGVHRLENSTETLFPTDSLQGMGPTTSTLGGCVWPWTRPALRVGCSSRLPRTHTQPPPNQPKEGLVPPRAGAATRRQRGPRSLRHESPHQPAGGGEACCSRERSSRGRPVPTTSPWTPSSKPPIPYCLSVVLTQSSGDVGMRGVDRQSERREGLPHDMRPSTPIDASPTRSALGGGWAPAADRVWGSCRLC